MRTRSITCLLLTLVLTALPASADFEITNEGRSARTGPKGTQSRLGEIPLDSPRVLPAESGRQMRGGRHLRAHPNQDVSVGLIGPPGTTTILEAIGGVFIDIGEWRGGRPRDSHRPLKHGPSKAPNR